ncbi:MAG: hypothetical protein WCT49_02045 [Candidatus Paceibacterota bacterium]|jgi:hypothetical protein
MEKQKSKIMFQEIINSPNNDFESIKKIDKRPFSPDGENGQKLG